jgi:hypothetical protein
MKLRAGTILAVVAIFYSLEEFFISKIKGQTLKCVKLN